MVRKISDKRYKRLIREEELEKRWNNAMKCQSTSFNINLNPEEYQNNQLTEAVSQLIASSSVKMKLLEAIDNKNEDYQNGFIDGYREAMSDKGL